MLFLQTSFVTLAPNNYIHSSRASKFRVMSPVEYARPVNEVFGRRKPCFSRNLMIDIYQHGFSQSLRPIVLIRTNKPHERRNYGSICG